MSRAKAIKIPFLSWIIWVCSLTFFLYEFFLRTFVGTLAQQIILDLNLTPELFALMGSAYYVAYGLMQVPVGYITDRFGAKKVILFASIVCGGSVIFFAASKNFVSGFFARMIMGLGSSFGFVSLLVIITRWFPRKVTPTIIGLSQFLGTLGPLIAAGPLATLINSSSKSWRDIFFQVGFIGFAIALFALVAIRNQNRNFQTDLVEVKREKKLSKLSKRLLKNKQVWFVALYSAFMYEVIDFLGAVWGTFYLQSRHLSLSEAGYAISLGWLGYAIGCFILVICSQWINKRKPILIFCSIVGTVSVSALIYIPFHSIFFYQIILFFIGLASSSQGLAVAVILEHVQDSIRALALGFNNGLIIIFGAIAPVISSAFIHLPKDRSASPQDFLVGFSLLPLLFLLGLVLSVFFIKETFCRPQKESVILRF